MRLRTIKQIIDANLPQLQLIGEGINRNTGHVNKLVNAKELQNALSEISKLGLFEARIEKIKAYPLYTHSNNSVHFSDNEFSVLTTEVNLLVEECNNLSNALSKLVKEDDANLISIKIPNPNNFVELNSITTKLNAIFSQMLFSNEIKGNVSIVNFDSGSYWIDIIASSAAVVQLIGGLAWSGVMVFKKLQDGLLVQAKVKEMKISNEFLQELIDKSKTAVNDVAVAEAKFLYNTFFKGEDNEQVERIKYALKELADLYSQGAEIHPAINAPSEVKDVFPDFKKLDKVETRMHKLTEKKK